MRIIYTSRNYNPESVKKRYVRFALEEFKFCEVSANRMDIRQGTVEESELPPEIAAKARKLCGTFPAYVEWPLP